MSEFTVYVNGEVDESFPHYEQAVIYCHEKKYVFQSFADFGGEWEGRFLIDGVEIKSEPPPKE